MRDKIVVSFGNNTIHDFLKLPSMIYDKDDNPQSISTEKKILDNKHILSKEISVIPFVVYRNRNGYKRPIGRCLLTYYKNDEKAYIGFFESMLDTKAVNLMLTKVEEMAKKDKKKELIGPVNASFWLGYRFKTLSDRDFNKTFTGEPYNKDYYTKLWKDYGFEIIDKYKSNLYRQVKIEDSSEKCKLRLRQMLDKGYIIKNSSFNSFNKDIEDIYKLLIKLYSNFPLFKNISLVQFKKLFGYLRYILNYSMVKIVYKDNEPVAFVICLPNLENNILGKVTIKKIINIIKLRNKPKEYVIMYMGVDSKHLGLGSALSEDIKTELYNNKCTSIGALILENKVTNSYYNKLIYGSTEYVILSKNIQ